MRKQELRKTNGPTLPVRITRHGILWLCGCLLAISLLGWTNGAHASSAYTAVVAETLEMSCVPQCTLCHTDNQGGFNTVTQPFGVTMREAGLGAARSSQLRALLMEVEEAETDSSGDGISDVEKLRTDQDPNQVGVASLCHGSPIYGCQATSGSLASEPPGGPFPWMAVAFGVLLAVSWARSRPQGR